MNTVSKVFSVRGLMALIFLVVGCLQSGWLFINWTIDHQFFYLYKHLILVFLLINLTFFLVLLVRKQIPALAISWLSICAFFLAGEATTIIATTLGKELPEIEMPWDGFGPDGYYDSHCAKWDANLGHRWVPGTHRIVKFSGNKLMFDNKFHVNNHGRLSQYNYTFQKPDSTKRYIVFGDSFTDLQYISKPWPDICMDTLNAVENSNLYELYNFGIHGGGLPAWYYTFFKEIIPKYEFDGIIMAVFGNDLARPHYYMHFENGYSYDGIFETPPSDNLKFKQALNPTDSFKAVYQGGKLDSLVNKIITKEDWKHSKFLPFNWYIFRNLYSAVSIVWFNAFWEKIESEFIYTEDPQIVDDGYLQKKYTLKKMEQLEEMIKYCKTHDKEFILVTIPGRLGLKAHLNGNDIILQQELDYLASKHQIRSYNGFKFFDGLRNDQVDDLYIKNDPHWNQLGAEIFAVEFSKVLLN